MSTELVIDESDNDKGVEVNEILRIPEVNFALLEKQIEKLHYVDTAHLKDEQRDAFIGVLSMLDSWLDTRLPMESPDDT